MRVLRAQDDMRVLRAQDDMLVLIASDDSVIPMRTSESAHKARCTGGANSVALRSARFGILKEGFPGPSLAKKRHAPPKPV
jgi:hypothetical protein